MYNKDMRTILFIAVFALTLGNSVPAGAQWWSANSSKGSSSSSSSRPSPGTTFGGGPAGWPVGTQTSASPRYYGSPGMSPAPGVPSNTGVGIAPGEFMYYNNAGMGYYRPNPTAPQYPAYPAPITVGGGYTQLGGLTERSGYWRAPSGYYYPWFPAVYSPGVAYPQAAAIYSLQQGLLTPIQPSVGSILSDMRQFIESAKEKRQLDQSNYENFFRRVNDLTARSSELASKNGGALNVSDDSAMRKEIDLLSADLARSLNP